MGWFGATLTILCINEISVEESSRMVNEYVAHGGSWDWEKLQHWFSSSVLFKLASIIPPNFSRGYDTVFWHHSASGHFPASLLMRLSRGRNGSV